MTPETVFELAAEERDHRASPGLGRVRIADIATFRVRGGNE